MWDLSTLLVSTLMAISLSTEVNFRKIDLEAAIQQAREEDKYIFLYFAADWCVPCKWMETHTFKDELVVFWLNDRFVAVKVDVETALGRSIKKENEIYTVPAMIFMDQDGKVLKKVNASVSANELKEIIKNIGEKEREQEQLARLTAPSYQIEHQSNIYRPALIPEKQSTTKPQIVGLKEEEPNPGDDQFEIAAVVVPRNPSSYRLSIGSYKDYDEVIDLVLRIEKILPIQVGIATKQVFDHSTYILYLDKVLTLPLAESYQQKLKKIGILTEILFEQASK